VHVRAHSDGRRENTRRRLLAKAVVGGSTNDGVFWSGADIQDDWSASQYATGWAVSCLAAIQWVVELTDANRIIGVAMDHNLGVAGEV